MTLIIVYSASCPHCTALYSLWDQIQGMLPGRVHRVLLSSDEAKMIAAMSPFRGVPAFFYMTDSGSLQPAPASFDRTNPQDYLDMYMLASNK